MIQKSVVSCQLSVGTRQAAVGSGPLSQDTVAVEELLSGAKGGLVQFL
jgi:hypothetical protein